jgi:hypothetical protein
MGGENQRTAVERHIEYNTPILNIKPQKHDLGDLSDLPWTAIASNDADSQFNLFHLLMSSPNLYDIKTMNDVVRYYLGSPE